MSSSCVPPKNCVIHDSDLSGHDDQSDASSECGSLCSCESGSIASLATINRAPERDNSTLVAPPAMPQAVPQTPGVEGDSGYFPVRVPQRATSESERSRCGGCQRTHLVAASLRHFLLTISEFFPWVAGFVIIYYSYCWWGMGSGFSAFLFMIGAHAVIRLVKTRGVLSCVPYKSQPHVESDPSSSESEDEEEPEQQQHAAQEVRVDWASEKPPSYEVAVVKPPPYDLQYHLTPQQHVGYLPVKLQPRPSAELLIVPSRLGENGDNDLFPPSYQDAMMLSLHSDTEDQGRRDGES